MIICRKEFATYILAKFLPASAKSIHTTEKPDFPSTFRIGNATGDFLACSAYISPDLSLYCIIFLCNSMMDQSFLDGERYT